MGTLRWILLAALSGWSLLGCESSAGPTNYGSGSAAGTGETVTGADPAELALSGIHGCVKAERSQSTRPEHSEAGDVVRRVQLQVLVLSADDVGTDMVKAGLNEGLVPCAEIDLLDAKRPLLDADFLADWPDGRTHRARFQAVVLPNEAPLQLSAAELQALAEYEREFGVRQLSSYVFPSAAVGLNASHDGGFEGSLDGMTAQLTEAARSDAFGYLQGAVPFDDQDPEHPESSGYLATPLRADSEHSFEPFLTMPIPGSGDRGVVIGVYRADGREQMVVTAAMNETQLQQQALFPGILGWLTYGVHLGAERNFLSVHVDDIFLPNTRWSGKACTSDAECDGNGLPEILMNAEDVDFLRDWQAEHGMKLDLLFNGSGYDRAVAKGPFPLGERLLADKQAFRWVSHTYNHLFLGCAPALGVLPERCSKNSDGAIAWTSYQDVVDQISRNQVFASRLGLSIHKDELVTGEHSGLRRAPQEPSDNPSLARALTAAGITWIGSDGSRENGQRRIGSALTSPRYPLNIYYDAATKAETVDEYNTLYTSDADGGSGECERNVNATCIEPLDVKSGFDDYIVWHEAHDMLIHILANSPRAHFVHQSNLTEERVIYPVLEHVLARYRGLFADSADIVNASLSELGRELQQQIAWATAHERVDAYIESGTLTLRATSGSVTTALTLPEAAAATGSSDLTAYGGAALGYEEITSTGQSYQLPESVGFKP